MMFPNEWVLWLPSMEKATVKNCMVNCYISHLELTGVGAIFRAANPSVFSIFSPDFPRNFESNP
jgi:hypothetical protein